MKKLLFAVCAPLLFCLPFAANAATYDYVTTAGAIQSVQASDSDQAFALATNRAQHSGVALVNGVLVSGVNQTYEYVSATGGLATVEASDPTQAFAEATNIAPHSGVMQI
jgi:hypothetical protein